VIPGAGAAAGAAEGNLNASPAVNAATESAPPNAGSLGTATLLASEAIDTALGDLLKSLGLPIDAPHLDACRQLMGQQVPLTSANVESLTRQAALAGDSSAEGFRAAAFLYARDLPITPESLTLVREYLLNPTAVGQQIQQARLALTSLVERLGRAATPSGIQDTALKEQIDAATSLLTRLTVTLDEGDQTQLLPSLRSLIQGQGTSVENRLSRILLGEEPDAAPEPDPIESELSQTLPRAGGTARQEEAPQLSRFPQTPLGGEEGKEPKADSTNNRITQQLPKDGGTAAQTAAAAEPRLAQTVATEEPRLAQTVASAEPRIDQTVVTDSGATEPKEGQAEARLSQTIPRSGIGSEQKARQVEIRPSPLPLRDAGIAELKTDLRVLLGNLARAADEVAVGTRTPEVQQGLSRVREASVKLADWLQAQQIQNAGSPPKGAENLSTFLIPFITGNGTEVPRTAELKVSHSPDDGLHPRHVRLVLQMEMSSGESVAVSLQVANRQVICSVDAGHEATVPLLRERFASLRVGVEQLGYHIASATFGVMTDDQAKRVGQSAPSRLRRVDVQA
jgi:hypothetical protein